MIKKKVQHKYLLQLYLKVNEFLNQENNNKDDLPEIIVAFCTVVEKILKIKLYKKNPLLVFDAAAIKDDNAFCIISKRKEKEIETIKIQQILKRYKILFRPSFSDEELTALRDIYELRNFFIHGYKPDAQAIFDTEDIIRKMGTLWEKISKLAAAIFGKETIKDGKPKKKYTESELEAVLIREVKAKIKAGGPYYKDIFLGTALSSHSVYSPYGGSGEQCPRCGNLTFSEGILGYNSLNLNTAVLTAFASDRVAVGSFSGIYQCDTCHLELTKKEFEIAKALKEK